MTAQLESIDTIRKALLVSRERRGPPLHKRGVKMPVPKGPLREVNGPLKLRVAFAKPCAVRSGPCPADDRLGPGEPGVVQPRARPLVSNYALVGAHRAR